LNSTSTNAACRPDCSLSRCGDGILDTGEQCDDENLVNGDGCDRSCAVESVTPTPTPRTLADTTSNVVTANFEATPEPPAMVNAQNIAFPQFQQFPNFQAMPMQLPLAQLQPIMQNAPQTAQSGPAAVAVVASGMAAGLGWMRRRRK